MQKNSLSSAQPNRTENTNYSYPIAPPYDMAYRNSIVPFPAGPHSHNATELYFTLTDLPDVLLNDTVSAVPAGTLLIIPTFCIHQLYHETNVNYERYVLIINTKWINGVFCNNPDLSYLTNCSEPLFLFPTQEQKKELIRLFNELLSFPNAATPKSMVAFFHCFSKIHDLAIGLEPKSELPISPSQEKVNDMIAYLQEHLHENVTTSDLAAHFYLNPDYLARLFKKHMHVPISHYVTLQKISTAQSLLREGKSVTQVQEILGYSSYAYFFKTFQKATGISPSQYRKQYHDT